MALVPQVVDAVDVPVVAAGGIMDGRGLLAALALGAAGAQIGTRFLLARESGAHAATESVCWPLQRRIPSSPAPSPAVPRGACATALSRSTRKPDPNP